MLDQIKFTIFNGTYIYIYACIHIIYNNYRFGTQPTCMSLWLIFSDMQVYIIPIYFKLYMNGYLNYPWIKKKKKKNKRGKYMSIKIWND